MFNEVIILRGIMIVFVLMLVGIIFELVLYYRLQKKIDHVLKFLKNASLIGAPVQFEEETEETVDG